MDDTTSTFTPAPPEPPRPAPRRLVRIRNNRMIAGVAAGLGEYFNVDPIVFRLGFVAAAFIGGLG
ncbi:MAG: PspC domain-containing protein, partial [Actinobacteria bacterium]